MTKAKRVRRHPDTRSVVGNIRDVEVLKSLAWARFLKTSQVARLHFPSPRTCQRRLRAMLDHGLVRAHLQGAAMHLENVFTLTPKGVAMLESRGVENVRRSRIPRLQKLAHGLAVRDVFAAFVLAEHLEEWLVQDFRFEEDLASEPAFKAAGIIPDAVAIIRQREEQQLVGCEVDLGTETTATLRSKLDAWRKLLDSGILGRAELLIVCEKESRIATFERLIDEVGVPATQAVARDMLLSPTTVARLFARTVRAVRTAPATEDDVFEPVWELKPAAF